MRFRINSNKPHHTVKVLGIRILQPEIISVLIVTVALVVYFLDCNCQKTGKIFLSEQILGKMVLFRCLKSPFPKISFFFLFLQMLQ